MAHHNLLLLGAGARPGCLPLHTGHNHTLHQLFSSRGGTLARILVPTSGRDNVKVGCRRGGGIGFDCAVVKDVGTGRGV
jgi:hypothetical protein